MFACLLTQQNVDHYHFIQRSGSQTVGSRQVYQFKLQIISLKASNFSFHCDAGIVSHLLVQTGQNIE